MGEPCHIYVKGDIHEKIACTSLGMSFQNLQCRWCYGLNCIFQNSYVQVLTPGTQNVTLFEDRVTADVISEDKIIRVGLNPIGLIYIYIKPATITL